MTKLLAARVHPWQAFRIRKWAEIQGIPLGVILAEAIQVFLSTQQIPNSTIERWLEEYREAKDHSHTAKGQPFG